MRNPFRRLKLADRYMLSETVVPFCTWLIALVVMILGNFLFLLLRASYGRRLDLDEVTRFLAFRVPFSVVLAIPMATLFSTSLALNRLARDGELVAMRIAGVSVRRLLAPYMAFSIALVLGCYVLNDLVVPWANHISQNAVRLFFLEPVTDVPQRDVVLRGSQGLKFYYRDADPKTNTLSDVMLIQPDPSGFPQITTARRAKLENNIWTLQNGRIYVFDRNGLLKYNARVDRAVVDLRQLVESLWEGQRAPDEMGTRELWRNIRRLKRAGVMVHNHLLELHTKFAIPFACFVFTFMGAPLVMRFGGGGSLTGVLIAVILIFVYYCLMVWGRILGQAQMLNPIFGAWVQNMVFVIAGAILYWRT